MNVITKAELAKLLGRSPKTIASDMVRRPLSLPPHFKLPGSSRPLWFRETVDAFLRRVAGEAGALPDVESDPKR